jgi:molybdate transport repressor ModE-like protein
MLAASQRKTEWATKVIESHADARYSLGKFKKKHIGPSGSWEAQVCELPNLRHLRVFQAVARLGSISGASREARVSQPAVTQGIAKLEALLDVVLFERRQSGCYLTEYGRAYLARADRMFAEMEGGLAAPRVGPPFADDKSLKSILAKTTAPMCARSWLSPSIARSRLPHSSSASRPHH